MLEKIKFHLSKMKVLDAIIIVFLFVASFIPHVVYGYQLGQIDEDAQIVAAVSIDGEVVYETELSEDTPHEEFTLYPGEDQYNVIEVDGIRIRNKEDNSPDQVGVRRGWISQPGETIVVLPHELIIEVHAVGGEDDEDQNPEEEGIIIPM